MEKIITLIAIWYVFWYVFSFIFIKLSITPPHFRIGGFDLIGDNIITFCPSFLYLVWRWGLLKRD